MREPQFAVAEETSVAQLGLSKGRLASGRTNNIDLQPSPNKITTLQRVTFSRVARHIKFEPI